MKPYYHQDGISIFLGDCREILPTLEDGFADVIITDPVWPNASHLLAGFDDPCRLFSEAAIDFPRLAKRLVVQLGCDSDPRFLTVVPSSLPLIRVCWLEYAFPNCKGRILNSGDVAYAFGTPPEVRPGRAVIPGRCTSGRVDFKAPGNRPWKNKHQTGRVATLKHPSPRRLEHVQWLVKWFTDVRVLDPFMGIGTTMLAAKQAGYPAAGIEIEEKYAEIAARRLEQGVLQFQD